MTRYYGARAYISASGQGPVLSEYYEDRKEGYGYCTNSTCKLGTTLPLCPACKSEKRPLRPSDRIRGVVDDFDDLRGLPLGFIEEFDGLFEMFPSSDMGIVRVTIDVIGGLTGVYGLSPAQADIWEDLLREVVREHNRGISAGRKAEKQARGKNP